MTQIKKYWLPLEKCSPSADQEGNEESQLSIRFYTRGKWTPDTDIYETEEGLLIIMDIAGVKKEEINITVKEKVLYISGVRREPEICKKNIYRLEIDFGEFEKNFQVPDSIDAEKIEARYEEGFLYLKLPRKQPRTIDITSE